MMERVLALGLIPAQTAQRPILLEVDATQAPRGIIRVEETLPVVRGKVRLSLPKWIPGEHSANGNLNDIVRLHFFAGDRELGWSRDPLDPFTFHLTVPGAGGPLRAEFVVASRAGDNLSSRLGRIKWNRLVLLPPSDVSRLYVRPCLAAPKGWTVQTALRPTPKGSSEEFDVVSAERLVDSPAQIGRYARSTELEPGYWLDLVADDPAQLDLGPELIASFRALIVQSRRLFAVRHFSQYRFLCNISDHIVTEGLEHHESGEDGVTSALRQGRFGLGDLVCHEMFHSWNGKYRRPKGLATQDFGTPYDTELLWVYEGLTRYYEHPLAVRAGFRSAEETRERLAAILARECAQSGRAWRSVADTALSVGPLMQATDPDWALDRRRFDYYEGACFVWLEVDATIRRLTRGRRSLDDFCRAFAGGKDTGPDVRSYQFEDVVRTLNGVAPHPWEKLLRSRLYAAHPTAPTEGVEGAGWRLVYGPTPNAFLAVSTYPAGLVVQPDGGVSTIVLDSPAYRAGLGSGDRILTVNGRSFSQAVFDEEIAKKGALRLSFEKEGETTVADLDYHGGLAYPHLERIEGTPDLLSEIFQPL